MADITGTFYAGDAFIGYGTELRVGQGDSPETFVAIADIGVDPNVADKLVDQPNIRHEPDQRIVAVFPFDVLV